MKICCKCKKEKLFSEFHLDRTRKDGVYTSCKECKLTQLRLRYDNLSLEEKEKRYSKRKSSIQTYYINNKDKKINASKEYYKINRTEILKRNTNYQKSHPRIITQKQRDSAKLYREKNREKFNQKQREQRERNRILQGKTINISIHFKNDTERRLASNLRKRLGRAIINNQKKGSAVTDLGCSIPELKQYLESKFQSGMTWENQGYEGWHIDHIIPLAKFNLNNLNEQEIAFHYTNLQPLWAKQNLAKGAK